MFTLTVLALLSLVEHSLFGTSVNLPSFLAALIPAELVAFAVILHLEEGA